MEGLQKSNKFLALLEKNASELAKEFVAYLDWIAAHGGDEQEGIYLAFMMTSN